MSPTLCALCLFAIPFAQDAQEPAADGPAALFYRAFYAERGARRPEAALALYQRFLESAPGHRYEGQAARAAVGILRRSRRAEDAAALAAKHAKAIAETAPFGINASFLDPKLDVARFVDRFESESREIFKHRHRILDLLGLEKGARVADIGAGTGFFTNLLARAVGPKGKVWAVEIAPRFVEHLTRLAKAMRLEQVETLLCTARSTKLAEGSIDLAFVCDTYHHFEHARDTLASIRRALVPGGELVVVDFERLPGKSRRWLLDHVRAGKGVFRAEIEAAGFELVREEKADFLAENYVLRFRKPSGR